MNTPVELLLSRNFVEFGPFSADELTAFAGRGLLRETDFVKAGDGEWQPFSDWLAATAEPKPVKAPAKKKAAKSKTAA